MKEINQVPGNAPQETPAPFEVIIRTTDPECLANGGEPEVSVKCDGYFMAFEAGGKTAIHAQGSQNLNNIVSGLVNAFGGERVLMAALTVGRKIK